MTTRVFDITSDQAWAVPMTFEVPYWGEDTDGDMTALSDAISDHFSAPGLGSSDLSRIAALRKGRSVRVSAYKVTRTQ